MIFVYFAAVFILGMCAGIILTVQLAKRWINRADIHSDAKMFIRDTLGIPN